MTGFSTELTEVDPTIESLCIVRPHPDTGTSFLVKGEFYSFSGQRQRCFATRDSNPGPQLIMGVTS